MSSDQEIFKNKVLPLMKEVQKKWEQAQRDEYLKHVSSSQRSMMGATAVDGGMAAMLAYDNTILHTGEWNRKTADDYLNTLKAELSQRNIKVTPVIEEQMIDYLISQKMPKSTGEYITNKIQEGNVFGSALPSSRSPLEGHIKQEAEKRYDPSLLEIIAGETSSFISNLVSTAGQGYLATLLDLSTGSLDQSEEQQKIYKDKRMKQAQKELATANKQQVSIPQWMSNQLGLSDLSAASTNQLIAAQEWAISQGVTYRKKVHDAIEQGQLTVKATGKTKQISLSDATLMAKQYEAFKRTVEKELTNRISVPQWMLSKSKINSLSEADDDKLIKAKDWALHNANFYRGKIDLSATHGSKSVNITDSKQVSLTAATTCALEYEAYAKAIDKELSNRKSVKKVDYGDIEDSPSEYTTYQNTSQNTDSKEVKTANKGDYAGWNVLLGELGLTGTSDTLKHFGVSLANLPDMLVGLFTGKMKTEGMDSNMLLPFALLLGGSFIKNPMLKISMLLWGATNLMNKSTQYANEKYGMEKDFRQATDSIYKRYADETLNQRMKNPQIEGNVLLVDVDNIPRIITLPPSVMDAYTTGALPLNTLANRILSKVDQLAINEVKSTQASEKFDNSQTHEQTKGLR